MVVFAASSMAFPRYSDTRLNIIAALLVTWLIYASMYIVPMPSGWISAISPAMAHWYSTKPDADLFLSVYRQASFIALIKFITLTLLFLTVCHLGRNLRNVVSIAHAIIFGCVLTALYSLLNFLTNGAFELINSVPPWDLAWKDGIRGTFSYKNQYALYLSLCLSLVAGLLIRTKQTVTARWYKAILTGSLLLLAITLINTSSRGALVALLAGCGLTTVLFGIRNRQFLQRFLSRRTAGIAAAVLLLALAGFSQSSVYDRFANQQLQDNGRAHLRDTAIMVIRDYPLTGTGPGTYPYIQHVYKPMALGISKMSKRAHNDYLETVASTGIVGFILLAAPLCIMLMLIFRRSTAETDGLLMGIRAALLTFLIQSAFDTNTGIFFLPALFMTVLAMGAVFALQHSPAKTEAGMS